MSMSLDEFLGAILILFLVVSSVYLSGRLWRGWVRSRWGLSPVRLVVVAGNVEHLVEAWLRVLLRELSRADARHWSITVVDRSTDDTGRILRRLAESVPEVSMPEPASLEDLIADQGGVVLIVPLTAEETARSHLATIILLLRPSSADGFSPKKRQEQQGNSDAVDELARHS